MLNDFCIFGTNLTLTCVFLSQNNLVRFYYQGDTDPIEKVRKCSFFFDLLGEFGTISATSTLNIWRNSSMGVGIFLGTKSLN